jgi:quercetin dioxygenase-like cupin family protein
MNQDRSLTPEEVHTRVIRHRDLVADKRAFIDVVIPGSEQKVNYAVVGSGVSQNAEQHIPVNEPHGFSVGAAAMPHGVTNSLHIHFTAEVFACFRGEWLLRWGTAGAEGELVLREGDVISMPTWMLRGFTNVGGDDGWLYTALGMDHTGGIIWDPEVLRQAEVRGLHLTRSGRLVEDRTGAAAPEGDEIVTPLSEAEIENLRHVTPGEMAQRLATPTDLAWSKEPFVDCRLPRGGAELALVVGYGMTEDRDQEPRVHNPHGFSLSWLRAGPGQGMSNHRHDKTQLIIVKDGRWSVTVNRSEEVTVELGPWDAVSLPPGAWRRFENVDDRGGQMLVLSGGDERVLMEWDEEVTAAAARSGLAHDANGYLAPAKVLSAHR